MTTLTEKAARLIECVNEISNLKKTDFNDYGKQLGKPFCFGKPVYVQDLGKRAEVHRKTEELHTEVANHAAQIARAFIIAENGLNKILNHKAIGQVSDQDFILQLRGIVRDALKEIGEII